MGSGAPRTQTCGQHRTTPVARLRQTLPGFKRKERGFPLTKKIRTLLLLLVLAIVGFFVWYFVAARKESSRALEQTPTPTAAPPENAPPASEPAPAGSAEPRPLSIPTESAPMPQPAPRRTRKQPSAPGTEGATPGFKK